MNFKPREQKFIDQMVHFYGKKTATQCAIDSGFGVAGARTRASELMTRTDIRNEIDAQLKEIREKWAIDKEKHFQELGELRELAKENKNINAAVNAEHLRGKVAGFYIDRQIIAATKLIQLPDGTKKAEIDLTEQDYQNILTSIEKKYNVISNTKKENKKKRTG